METTVTFEHGPLTVEIHALEEDNYQEELLDLLEFLDSNQEQFEGIDAPSEPQELTPGKPEVASLDQFKDGDEEELGEEKDSDSPLSEIASELRIPVRELDVFLDVGEERPVMYLDELDDIGKKQSERQRVVSLILLYLWHEYYDKQRVKSSALKGALELSNVSSSGMANMYQGDGDRYFDRRGRGPSATVKLTPPGKRQARKLLREFVNKEDSE